MKNLINDPEHWRKRAKETRELAHQMRDPEQCRQLLEIAAGLEQIAHHAEKGPLAHDD